MTAPIFGRYIDEDGEEGYDLNLAAALAVSYVAAERPDAEFGNAGAKAKLNRFHAAVERRIASELAMGRKISICDAAFAIAGGEHLVSAVEEKSGTVAAVDFVLDECGALS